VVGAGPAGTLLTILLARRGFRVALYDRRLDPRTTTPEAGRSINLALAARGIRALERAGAMARIQPHLIPVRGRMVHETDGATTFLPYGQNEREVIHSFSRTDFNRALIEEAATFAEVVFRFGQACLGARPGDDALGFRDRASGSEYEVALTPTIAADGAGSAVRTSLQSAGLLNAREDPLEHDYKELTIPPREGHHALDPGALHVWPRGGFMFMALPNTDASFTATLFLPREGGRGFARLGEDRAVAAFFAEHFPDAVPLMPDLLREFRDNPQGRLGTLHVDRWHVGGKVLLLGDAAHAIVPFHGQGLNCAFEDCVVFDELLEGCGDWSELFAGFEQRRRANAEAIAAMALENYVEMRDTVRDPRFLRQKQLALALERRFPDRFIPRYSMVMFHPEIGYEEARRRGAVQQQILDELDRGAAPLDEGRARELIESRLTPIR
jgi:kynurenine 3-monooxygenase